MKPSLSANTVAALMALTIGTGVFCLALVGDFFLLQSRSSSLWAVADNLLMGLFAALLVLAYERRRLRELRRKLDTIRETNHHIRNQLQIIEYSLRETDDPELVTRLHEAVGRIDWVLREIVGKQ